MTFVSLLQSTLDAGVTERFSGSTPDLTLRTLALAAAATAGGHRDTVRAALRVGLARGTPPEQLYEVLLQTYLFAGYPRAINALADLAALVPDREADAVIDLEPRDDTAGWLDRGTALCRKVYGERYQRLLSTMARISPDLGRWMILEGYGKVLSRPGLSPVAREITAVAALVPLGVPDQLRAHLRGALLVGADEDSVRGVLEVASLIAPARGEEAAGILERVKREV